VKAVPDTNILISAIIWGGNPARLIEAGIRGKIELFLSPEIIAETLGVLKRKGFNEERLSEAQEYITAATTLVHPTVKLDVVKDDPKDNHIIDAAVAAGADAIITGDKDLLRMKEYQGIKMMQVAEFLGQQRGL
jgi:uncharacterized protein